MTRHLTRLLAGAAAVLLGLTVATPAGATTTEPDDRQLQPVVVVMDYSSSMLKKDADSDGTSRLDAAKSATKHLIGNAPDDARLGLVVYGSTDPDSCSDISTLQKPGTVDKAALTKKIDELEALGQTPIGASLLHAADDLEGVSGEKSIILVSDGNENCDEPPACEAAQDLASRGIDLTIHTIGFRVGSTARSELECIADATGGTYVSAENASDLEDELNVKTLRAFQGYDAAGERIEGGARLHEAPTLVPGQYIDEYERGDSRDHSSNDGTTKFYKVGPIEPGERAHFAAQVIPEQGAYTGDKASGHLKVEVEFVNGQGDRCSGSGNEWNYGSTLGAPLVAYVLSPEYRQDRSDRCYADGSGDLYAKVIRGGTLQKDTPLDVELKFVLEPAVDATLLDQPVRDRDTPSSVTITGDAEPINGGSSFNSPADVASGKVYSDSVQPNEGRYYRIHVGHGQKLNYRLTNGNNVDAGAQQIQQKTFSAVREPVSMLGGRDNLWYNNPNSTITVNMETAVSQSNRDGNIGDDAYLGGDYYVVVYADTWSSDRNRTPSEYEIAFEVTGTEQPFPGAAPIFEGERHDADPAAGDDEPASDSSTGPAEDGTDDGGGEGQSDDGTEDPVATEQASNAGRPILPWFAGGLITGLVIIAVAGFLFRNRSKPMPAQQPGQPGTPNQENL
ncbi:hypothetical protein BJH93_02710 [Kocuria polaris]|nr:hypothetical protein [Kocuria polaris]